MKIERLAHSSEILFNAISNGNPELMRLVRMKHEVGSWRLTRVGVDHEFKGDPEGNVPAGIVDLFVVQGPMNTFSSIIRIYWSL